MAKRESVVSVQLSHSGYTSPMIGFDEQNDPEQGLPSRTAILVAAARAFGALEPDESVRNPDSLANLLIGQPELALISEHPICTCLERDYSEASQDPAIMMFAAMMIWRTRFIDEALVRAVKNGTRQVVILGAGFDSRAYRFRDLLKDCRVIEVDAAPTQKYKRRRVEEALHEVPTNVIYCTIDFAKDNLTEGLRQSGFNEGERTFYIWEGVCMYLPEDSVREMLQWLASHSHPGSSVVLDYTNSLGIEYLKLDPHSLSGIPPSWGEPWIFGVPGANGSEFFRELGFDPGVPLSSLSPEIIKRYGTRKDGTSYAAEVFEKMRIQMQTKSQALPGPLLDLQKAIAAAGGAYWLAELTIAEHARKS
jgi:methyltransferase (TIGR00027 family)